MLDTTGISMAQRAITGQTVDVRFVRPVISAILACSRLIRSSDPVVNFAEGAAAEYARHSGLAHALTGDYHAMVRPYAGVEGRTWSRLTTLYRHDEIESCNRTINDLLFAQLAFLPRQVLDAIARVIGELHDNVASHSNGRGFSCAQFYPSHPPHPDRLELAVADAGQGFLRNVRRVEPSITTDADAIRWCLQKGNTSWRPSKPTADPSPWGDPYAEGAELGRQQDHHMGWGLWLLSELVRSTQSTLWVWTGNASYTLREDGSEALETTTVRWPGVLIDMAVYPERARQVDFAQITGKLKKLAEELGL